MDKKYLFPVLPRRSGGGGGGGDDAWRWPAGDSEVGVGRGTGLRAGFANRTLPGLYARSRLHGGVCE
jgi:hypothetical protein